MRYKKNILYLGLDPTRYVHEGVLTHYPLIRIQPLVSDAVDRAFATHPLWTHLLCTSRSAVEIFFRECARRKIAVTWPFLVVGRATEEKVLSYGAFKTYVAPEAQGEGIVTLLSEMHFGHLFFPHSSLARPLIVEALKRQNIPHTALPLYTTLFHHTPPPSSPGGLR